MVTKTLLENPEMELAMAGKRSDKGSFLHECRKCKGVGKVQSEVWEEFWREHRHDWQDEIARGGSPKEEEFSECPDCRGVGRFALQGNSPLVELFIWISDMQSKVDLKAVYVDKTKKAPWSFAEAKIRK